MVSCVADSSVVPVFEIHFREEEIATQFTEVSFLSSWTSYFIVSCPEKGGFALDWHLLRNPWSQGQIWNLLNALLEQILFCCVRLHVACVWVSVFSSLFFLCTFETFFWLNFCCHCCNTLLILSHVICSCDVNVNLVESGMSSRSSVFLKLSVSVDLEWPLDTAWMTFVSRFSIVTTGCVISF